MVTVDNLTLFYFTGTGNSGKVAEWISQVAEELNVPCELINIAKIDRRDFSKLNLNSKTNSYFLFVSPTHGFNYPPLMMHFIMRFPKAHNKVGFVNTRGGLRVGKWVTPGLSGIALLLSALIMMIKGYSIQAMYPVDLPSNWILLHPGLRRKTIKYLHVRNKERVQRFARKLFNGKKVLKGLRDIIQDILISPIAVGYYLVGRFALSKTLFASSACTNCDLCIKDCPVKAIKKINNRYYWTYKCESCMHCINHCPERAIEAGHGFFIGFIILYTSVLIGLFYKLLDGVLIEIKQHWIESLINNILFLILLFFSYRLFHYLLQFRWFSKIAEYTSLTRYKFWGKRYKALKDKDF